MPTAASPQASKQSQTATAKTPRSTLASRPSAHDVDTHVLSWARPSPSCAVAERTGAETFKRQDLQHSAQSKAPTRADSTCYPKCFACHKWALPCSLARCLVPVVPFRLQAPSCCAQAALSYVKLRALPSLRWVPPLHVRKNIPLTNKEDGKQQHQQRQQ